MYNMKKILEKAKNEAGLSSEEFKKVLTVNSFEKYKKFMEATISGKTYKEHAEDLNIDIEKVDMVNFLSDIYELEYNLDTQVLSQAGQVKIDEPIKIINNLYKKYPEMKPYLLKVFKTITIYSILINPLASMNFALEILLEIPITLGVKVEVCGNQAYTVVIKPEEYKKFIKISNEVEGV